MSEVKGVGWLPGQKVVCEYGEIGTPLVRGATYTISDCNREAVRLQEAPAWVFRTSCFRLRDPALAPPAPVVLTDELRAALVAWYRAHSEPVTRYMHGKSTKGRLYAAIEATPGLLPDPAPPPPGTTDAVSSLHEGWWA